MLIQHSPLSLSSFIVFLSQVFTLRRVLKDLSMVLVEHGSTSAINRQVFDLRKKGAGFFNDFSKQWRLQCRATWAIALGPAPYKGLVSMKKLTDLTLHLA